MQLAMPRASPRRLRGRHERPLFCLAEAEQGWALLWQRQKKAHRDPPFVASAVCVREEGAARPADPGQACAKRPSVGVGDIGWAKK